MLEYRLFLLTVLATLSLIILGGIVHNTESSLACPDWPFCYGELLPDHKGGVGIEMSHRILASSIGLLTIVCFLVLVVRKKYKASITILSFFSILLVMAQGGLGALTVLYRLPTLISTAHLATAQLFLALLVAITYLLKLSSKTNPKGIDPKTCPKLKLLLGCTVLLIYTQMILGALVRHTGCGLAAGFGSTSALIGIDTTTGEHSLWPTLPQGQINVFHRYMALFVFLLTLIVGKKLYRLGSQTYTIFKCYAIVGNLLILIQILLGIFSIWFVLYIPLITAHLAVGTLCLMVWLGAYLHLKFALSPYDYRKPVSV